MKNNENVPTRAITNGSLNYDAIVCQIQYLQGNVLTIIDASFQDPEQRKAAKDLVNAQFSRKLEYFWELCNGNPERTVK